MMAEASTISGSSSIATNPAVLALFEALALLPVAVLAVLLAPEFDAELEFDAVLDDPLVVLAAFSLPVASGIPPAMALQALNVTAPIITDLTRWRIKCAPLKTITRTETAPWRHIVTH